MTHVQSHSPSRRAFVGFLATAAVAGLATQAAARGGASPSDRIPRHFSLDRFTSLDGNDIHRINRASRSGRQITIGDLSPSESRKLLRKAAADWPATRATLLR